MKALSNRHVHKQPREQRRTWPVMSFHGTPTQKLAPGTASSTSARVHYAPCIIESENLPMAKVLIIVGVHMKPIWNQLIHCYAIPMIVAFLPGPALGRFIMKKSRHNIVIHHRDVGFLAVPTTHTQYRMMDKSLKPFHHKKALSIIIRLLLRVLDILNIT